MNKVIIMGRLTREPEVRVTQTGRKVARMSLAVDRPKTQNNQNPGADFVTLIAWEKSADVLQRWTTKGTKLLIEGRLSVRSYEASDGSKRTATEVIIERWEFSESKKAGGADTAETAPPPEPTAFDDMGTSTEEEVPF